MRAFHHSATPKSRGLYAASEPMRIIIAPHNTRHKASTRKMQPEQNPASSSAGCQARPRCRLYYYFYHLGKMSAILEKREVLLLEAGAPGTGIQPRTPLSMPR